MYLCLTWRWGTPGRWGTSEFPRSKKSCAHMQYFEPRGDGVRFVTAIVWRVVNIHKIYSQSACDYSKGWFWIDYKIHMFKQFFEKNIYQAGVLE